MGRGKTDEQPRFTMTPENIRDERGRHVYIKRERLFGRHNMGAQGEMDSGGSKMARSVLDFLRKEFGRSIISRQSDVICIWQPYLPDLNLLNILSLVCCVNKSRDKLCYSVTFEQNLSAFARFGFPRKCLKMLSLLFASFLEFMCLLVQSL